MIWLGAHLRGLRMYGEIIGPGLYGYEGQSQSEVELFNLPIVKSSDAIKCLGTLPFGLEHELIWSEAKGGMELMKWANRIRIFDAVFQPTHFYIYKR